MLAQHKFSFSTAPPRVIIAPFYEIVLVIPAPIHTRSCVGDILRLPIKYESAKEKLHVVIFYLFIDRARKM